MILLSIFFFQRMATIGAILFWKLLRMWNVSPTKAHTFKGLVPKVATGSGGISGHGSFIVSRVNSEGDEPKG